jgi:addiction module HigA family antidote
MLAIYSKVCENQLSLLSAATHRTPPRGLNGPGDVEIGTIMRGPSHMPKKRKPMHPGEVLREEFLVPLKMSAGALAKACGLPRTRIERIASKQTGVTADTALRLGKALGTTAQLWLNLQNDHDVEIAKRELGKALDRIQTVNKPQAA